MPTASRRDNALDSPPRKLRPRRRAFSVPAGAQTMNYNVAEPVFHSQAEGRPLPPHSAIAARLLDDDAERRFHAIAQADRQVATRSARRRRARPAAAGFLGGFMIKHRLIPHFAARLCALVDDAARLFISSASRVGTSLTLPTATRVSPAALHFDARDTRTTPQASGRAD